MINKKLPDFLIIGAGKSGTTSLDYYLKQHAQVYMPEVKEPNFFGYEAHSMEDFNDEETKNHYHQSVTNLNDYEALFDLAKPDQLIGEVSNTTMYMPHAITSIQKHLGEPKMIAILRNPADRLVSRFMHLERVNKVPGITLNQVFDRESIWWERADLVNEGFYHKHLSNFFSSFDTDLFHIIIYDDLRSDVNGVLKGICHFLEIDSSFNFDTSTVYNKSGKVKNRAVQNLIGDNSKVINSLKKVVPGLHKYLKNSNVLRSTVEKLRTKNLGKPEIDSSLKKRMIDEIYLKDIQKLESLLGRDLGKWYR